MTPSNPTGTIDRDGFRLTYRREGEGPPILVLGSPRYYQRVLPASLRSSFELVFTDLRPWVDAPADFDVSTITGPTHLDDIDAVRRAAGLDRPIVLGHSIHATLALEYARHHPDAVQGVVAVAAAPIGGGELWQSAADFWASDADDDRRAAHERNLAQRRTPTSLDTGQDFIDQYVLNGALYWYDPTFDATPLWDGVAPNMAVLMQLFTIFGDGYRVEPIDVPVLLALGRHDYVAPFGLWDDEQERFPHLHRQLYGRSGHTPPYEQPEAFSADLIAWANVR